MADELVIQNASESCRLRCFLVILSLEMSVGHIDLLNLCDAYRELKKVLHRDIRVGDD